MTIKANTSDAAAGLEAAGRAVSPAALAEVAEDLAAVMGKASERAFAQKVDPATGRPWEQESALTRGSRGFKSLLVRSGELQQSVVTETHRGQTSAFARVGLDASARSVLVRGLTHFYGVKARKRRSNRTARVRPQQSMPSRRFAGISTDEIKAFMSRVERSILGAAE